MKPIKKAKEVCSSLKNKFLFWKAKKKKRKEMTDILKEYTACLVDKVVKENLAKTDLNDIDISLINCKIRDAIKNNKTIQLYCNLTKKTPEAFAYEYLFQPRNQAETKRAELGQQLEQYERDLRAAAWSYGFKEST